MGHSNREFTRRLGDFSLTSIFPRWTSGFRCSLSTVRIKALQANEIPRFQMNSVRTSAGRQNRTPLDVSAGRQTGRNYPSAESNAGVRRLVRHPYIRIENLAKRRDLERTKNYYHLPAPSALPLTAIMFCLRSRI